MYRLFLRIFAAISLLFAFWPVLRLASLTVFDVFAPFVILFALPYAPKEKGTPFRDFRLAALGVMTLLIAGIIASFSSNDMENHAFNVFRLVVALSGMIGVSFVVSNRRILSVVEALNVLCFSALIHSIVCILQGRFGMLTSVVPTATYASIEEWSRMTGLAEHPIEAGYISVFGGIIAIGLAMHLRKWIIYVPVLLVDVFAMKYSASLTALIALMVGIAAFCWITKSWKFLLSFGVAGVLGLAILLTSGGGTGDRLTSRISQLVDSQGNYGTLQARENGWKIALNRFDAGTAIVGNGYAETDLPPKLIIHNGVIAAIYHFGVLGLLSQVLLISFFAIRITYPGQVALRGILLGCVIIFLCAYMTGPPFSRRSLWFPVLIVGAYIPRPQKGAAPPPRAVYKAAGGARVV